MDKFWSFKFIKWHQITVCNLLNFKTLDGCADIYPVWFINVILVFSLTTFLEQLHFEFVINGTADSEKYGSIYSPELSQKLNLYYGL